MGRYDNVMKDYLQPLQGLLRHQLEENPGMSDDEIRSVVEANMWGKSGMYDTFISRHETDGQKHIYVSIGFLVVPQEIEIGVIINKEGKEDGNQ